MPHSPPQSPPPDSKATGKVVQLVNKRYSEGRPSNDILEAGLFIHQLDAYDDSNPLSPWMPCPRGAECEAVGDRFSATVISQRTPFVYDQDVGGFVLESSTLEIFCAWAHDGGTENRLCYPPGKSDTCTPGCGPAVYEKDYGGPPKWCDEADINDPYKWCPWRPNQLQNFRYQHDNLWPLRQSYFGCHPNNDDHHQKCLYNEVVVSAETWVKALPHTVSAVFFMKQRAGTHHEFEMRKIHREFLLEYGLNEADVPLLSLDLEGGQDQPFVEVSNPPPPPSRTLPRPRDEREGNDLVEFLNGLFLFGRPSNELSDVGVIVHQFDAADDEDTPWLTYHERKEDDGEWATKFNDRRSLSVINKDMPYLYNMKGGAAGFIVDPATVHLWCAWAQDGLTMGHHCNPHGISPDGNCVPGCHGPKMRSGNSRLGEDGRPDWCDPANPVWAKGKSVEWNFLTHFCPWRPENLRQALEQNLLWKDEKLTYCDQKKHDGCRYNELVAAEWALTAHMPDTILAFFYLAGPAGASAEALAAQQKFLRHFRLGSYAAPLLELDLESSTPFTRILSRGYGG